MASPRQLSKPINKPALPALHHLSSWQGSSSLPSAVMETRFLILSDTHATAYTAPQQYADVALHCGDLTEKSTLDEFRSAIQLLEGVSAPIKLAIGGNHDFTLDTPLYKQRFDQASPAQQKYFKKEYGDVGEARRLLETAGITLLDEGTHHFRLQNGASLSVYASPHTPIFGYWGFQYPREQGHEFDITGADVVMTHGPPRGILDETYRGNEAGCTNLFGAIAQARPKIHCFGHIHEAWGAKLVAWQDTNVESSYSTSVDEKKSVIINSLKGSQGSEELMDELKAHQHEGYYATSHCTGDPNPIQQGKQTLAINASIKGRGRHRFQLPWLVDIELPKTD
ncbi:metallophosphoesterase domain-containing protein 2 [Arthroderma uncinatum]|uniref:metallophosphoesterase domain-containing protein 2 n=1 Tax=Arthroderma uncinatum TaxID=74035 RepID=UPI00144A6C7A|nr:metallophosphoesterase domain-containing protein 2 [Arthroderma uncinatum]KAF3483630.1 metallophosphoesterase domain-containing protein 2 [Arthroderma uncinatum]